MKNLALILSLTISSLMALGQPVITLHPEDQSACADTCATFEVAAVGTGMQYFWMMSNDTISGASIGNSSPTLVICDSIVQYDSANFWCVIVDDQGDSAVTESAMLTIDACAPPVAGFDFYFMWDDNIVCYESTSENADVHVWLFGDSTTYSGTTTDTCKAFPARLLYYTKLIVYNDHGSDEITRAIDILAVEDDKQVEFSIFPNPTSNYVLVESESRIESITLLDISGRVVLSHAGTSKQREQIDVSDLQSGQYVLRIDSEEGTSNRMIVIN